MPRLRPRPRPVEGGWLTGTARGPAGYCADHAGTPHATADEAYACHRKYLIEQTLNLDGARGASGQCIAPRGCETVTNRTVVINGYPRGFWCDEDRTTEAVTAWWNAPRAEAQAAP